MIRAHYVLLVGGLAVMFGISTVTLASQDSRAADAATSPTDGRVQAAYSRASAREHCRATQKAIGFYRRKYTASRTAMGLPGAVPRQWYPCDAARRRAKVWRARAHVAALELAAWHRDQYAWWTWMPRGSKEYRVASCETGYGRDPNWAHDSGTYVSAFGIYRAGYADDAHRVGNLGWDETIRRYGRIPSPREQYQAMMSHRAAHGGWSGWGCRGA